MEVADYRARDTDLFCWIMRKLLTDKYALFGAGVPMVKVLCKSGVKVKMGTK
jgi:hypothetical protein